MQLHQQEDKKQCARLINDVFLYLFVGEWWMVNGMLMRRKRGREGINFLREGLWRREMSFYSRTKFK